MSAALIDAHDAAYDRARGCPVYAPGKDVDPSVALMNATRSGATSARCSDEWMRLFIKMKAAGLKSARHPHLFREQPA